MALDVKDAAELPARHDRAQPLHGRPESSVVSDREQDMRLAAGRKHRLRIDAAQRQRLFAEHLLSCRGGRDHLGLVLRMRRRQQDGVDRRVIKDRLEIAGQRDAVRGGEIARALEIGFNRMQDLQSRVAPGCFDKGAAPAAEAGDRAGDHGAAPDLFSDGRIASMIAALSQSSPRRAMVSRRRPA